MLHTLVLLALAQVADPSAARTLTLEQAFGLADTNHVDVQLADLSLQQAAQDEKGSYAGILPRADLAAQLSKSYSKNNQVLIENGAAVPVTSGWVPTFWGAQLTAQQNIIDGGKWWTRISKGHADREAAEAQLAEARLQAHQTVGHLFYELVRAGRSLEILQVNVQRSQEQVDRAQALFEAGRGPKSDYYAAQVNLANDEIAVAQQRAKTDVARNNLNIALGQAAEQPIDAKPPDLSARPATVNASQADEQALKARPGLAALRKQIDSSGMTITLAKGDYYPALNASLMYQYQRAPAGVVTDNAPWNNYTATGSLNLQWNLFNGRSTDVAVQKAELAQSAARVNLIKSERQVTQDTETAVRTLTVNLEALSLAEKANQAANLGLQLAQERFKAGAASNLEVRDAQLKLTSAELNLVSTQIDVHLADLDVRAAEGAL
ncbi:MAG: TolC family protein [Deltaproteobacteria bacterium]|nr:TolC family protein [Deltaproteobacteria bacterium]